MRLPQTLVFLLAFITTIHALALPASFRSLGESSKELYKRKGGGGGGGKGGGGGGSESSSGGSSSGSSGGARGSTTSNTGGRSSSGSGVAPTYGGGRYYGGGAAVPYRSGTRSGAGISPYFLGGAALGIFPGLWLYGAYAYPYGHPYTYYNDTSNQNETHPVTCLCGEYQECGCDSNNDTSYITSVANNQTLSQVANVNGTNTLVVNGTLPNGTTAAGGTDSAASSLRQGLMGNSGLWVVVAGVAYTMWFMQIA